MVPADKVEREGRSIDTSMRPSCHLLVNIIFHALILARLKKASTMSESAFIQRRRITGHPKSEIPLSIDFSLTTFTDKLFECLKYNTESAKIAPILL